ncbi:MAG: hypothetical protein Q9M34_06990 [Sulfurimonas sp.]|nr:hypothetical protein [Sulfurimonas sp.]
MNKIIINFNVTPSQKETIELRMRENGFDDISSYVKVVALKTQKFSIKNRETLSQEASVELSFSVTEAQNAVIEKNVKEYGCENMNEYMCYVSLHGVVSAVIEIRSTGNLNAMLQRIAKSRGLKLDLD